MKVKFSELSDIAPEKIGTYRQIFNRSNLKRKYDFDSQGKKIELPKPLKLNTLVLKVKNTSGEIKERVFDFAGNKLIISAKKKRELTPELIKTIEKIGEETFAPDSYFNVVINSLGTKIKGNACYVENSNGANVTGDGCYIKDNPHANVGGNNLKLIPITVPFVRKYVTASQLYDYDLCPHRVWRNANLLKEEIDPPNEFLQLLWEKGVLYEEKVVSEIGEGKYLDLSEGTDQERAQKTIEAMKSGVPLIYQGVLIADELFGEPDLLQRLDDGSYIPIDIKAAMGVENNEAYEDGKLKESYAMQLCLYADALIRLGFTKNRLGIIFDVDSKKVLYDLNSQRNKRDKRTFWDVYEVKKDEVLALSQNKKKNEPALKSDCKLCHWLSSCTKWCEDTRDLSLIYKLGRAFKETIIKDTDIRTIDDLAKADVAELAVEKVARGSDFLKGIGEGHLTPFIRRAQHMASGAKGVKILNPFSFPKKSIELSFDIETDPTQDFVCLHGFVERRNGEIKCKQFFAKDLTREAEKAAWKEAVEYIRSLPKDYVVIHYGVYEKVIYNKLRQKYPDVISQKELNDYFGVKNDGEEVEASNKLTECVDLYRLLDRNTDWPVKSYGLKSLSHIAGFEYRDPHPSGSAFIQWFNVYLTTKDPEVLRRCLEYNEDDCKAALKLKDYVDEELKIQVPALQRISLPLV